MGRRPRCRSLRSSWPLPLPPPANGAAAGAAESGLAARVDTSAGLPGPSKGPRPTGRRRWHVWHGRGGGGATVIATGAPPLLAPFTVLAADRLCRERAAVRDRIGFMPVQKGGGDDKTRISTVARSRHRAWPSLRHTLPFWPLRLNTPQALISRHRDDLCGRHPAMVSGGGYSAPAVRNPLQAPPLGARPPSLLGILITQPCVSDDDGQRRRCRHLGGRLRGGPCAPRGVAYGEGG